jgi:hypothetical protein
MDGISLNKELGVEEIFDWQVIQGEPFFFVRENNTSAYSLVFAGQQLDHEYDEIVHYQCCEPAAFNPGGTIYMTWFFASRNASGITWKQEFIQNLRIEDSLYPSG